MGDSVVVEDIRNSRQEWVPVLILLVLITLTQLIGDPAREWLRYDRALLADGQAWRAITGSFVHLGWYHWLLNALALAGLWLMCPERLPPWAWAARVTVLSLGMSAGLFCFAPEVTRYVGLSGPMHGLYLLGLAPLVRQRDLIACGALLFLLGKIGWEIAVHQPLSDTSAMGGAVVTQSHLFGTLAALVYGLVAGTFFRKPQEPR